jgi:hypothetical protein
LSLIAAIKGELLLLLEISVFAGGCECLLDMLDFPILTLYIFL